MPRKKGRRAVPDIVKTNAAEVLSEARKKNIKMKAPALKKATEALLKKRGWNIKYTDRTYLNIMNELEGKLEFEELEAPWSIGSCLEFGISMETIPVLLKIDSFLSSPHERYPKVILTNRIARWINLLW